MKKEELNFIEWSVLEDFWKFLEAHKIAKEVGGYVLSSRGTKKFYTIVDKKTYDKVWEKYGKQYTFKPKYKDYIMVPLDYNQDIYIGDIKIKIPLYSGTIDLKEFMKENKDE